MNKQRALSIAVASAVFGLTGAVIAGGDSKRAASAPYQDAIASWPERSQQVAKKIAAAYGDPDEVTPTMLVWHQTGPWKRTIVHREEVPHDFPKPHTDIVEQVIDYAVPVDKYDDLAAYDGSVVAKRTEGELSARCDDEKMNFLAINLAHDIATGARGVDDARQVYGEAAAAVMKKEKPAYTQRLQFALPDGETGDRDRPLAPETKPEKPAKKEKTATRRSR